MFNIEEIRAALLHPGPGSEGILKRATLLRALEEALAMAEWQPIETAPLWQEVIVYQKSVSPTKSNKNGVFTAVRVEKGWALTRFGPGYSHNPTHWMPLPEPPALKEPGQ